MRSKYELSVHSQSYISWFQLTEPVFRHRRFIFFECIIYLGQSYFYAGLVYAAAEKFFELAPQKMPT